MIRRGPFRTAAEILPEAEALPRVKADAHDLARGLLHKLWPHDLLREPPSHAQVGRAHARQAVALGEVHELQRLEVHVSVLVVLEAVHGLEVIDELTARPRVRRAEAVSTKIRLAVLPVEQGPGAGADPRGGEHVELLQARDLLPLDRRASAEGEEAPHAL